MRRPGFAADVEGERQLTGGQGRTDLWGVEYTTGLLEQGNSVGVGGAEPVSQPAIATASTRPSIRLAVFVALVSARVGVAASPQANQGGLAGWNSSIRFPEGSMAST